MLQKLKESATKPRWQSSVRSAMLIVAAPGETKLRQERHVRSGSRARSLMPLLPELKPGVMGQRSYKPGAPSGAIRQRASVWIQQRSEKKRRQPVFSKYSHFFVSHPSTSNHQTLADPPPRSKLAG